MSYPILQDVKNYLGISGTDDDFLLGLQLTQAISIVESKTGRTFVCTADSSKTFYSDNRAIVNRRKFLLYDDLCALTSLTINGNAIASNKYRTDSDTPYGAIELFPTSDYFFEDYSTTEDPSSFVIVGRWAYSIDCPRDVFGAILRLTAFLYHQKDNAADYDRPVAFSNTLELSSSLPTDVVEILKKYERIF
mgnify:CR=1 FL=1